MNQYRGSHKQQKMKIRLSASNFVQITYFLTKVRLQSSRCCSANNFDVKLDGKCLMMTS